jgi:hypothetical protein
MNRSSFLGTSLILFVAGLVVLFSSVSLGSEAANAYLRSQGGGMDGGQFMIVFQESIGTYRWIGVILSLIGGLGIIKAVEIRPGT